MKDGTLALIVSSPSNRDTIYVGFVYRDGDAVRVENATMVVRYGDGNGYGDGDGDGAQGDANG